MSVFLGILFCSIFSGVITKNIEPNTLPEMLPSPEQLTADFDIKCDSNEECAGIGLTCTAGICQCTLPFKNGNDSCIFGGVCENSKQCTRNHTFHEIMCYPQYQHCKSFNKTLEDECHAQEKTCKCQNEYVFKDSACIKKFIACKRLTTDCKDNGVCVDDICQCMAPFQKIDDKCEFGSQCTDDNDCSKIPNVMCNDNKCSCPKAMHFDGIQCIPDTSSVSQDSKREAMGGSGSARSYGFILSITMVFFSVSSIIL